MVLLIHRPFAVSSLKIQIPGTQDPPCYHRLDVSEILVVPSFSSNSTDSGGHKEDDGELVSALDSKCCTRGELESGDSADEEMTTTTSTIFAESEKQPCLQQLNRVVARRLAGSTSTTMAPEDDEKKKRRYELYYEDKDGDLVILSSNQVLCHALIEQPFGARDGRGGDEGGDTLKIVPKAIIVNHSTTTRKDPTTATIHKDYNNCNGTQSEPALPPSPSSQEEVSQEATVPFMIKLCLAGEDSKCRRISLDRILNEENDLPSLDKLFTFASELKDTIGCGNGGGSSGGNSTGDDNLNNNKADLVLVCVNPRNGHSRVLESNTDLDQALDQCSTVSQTNARSQQRQQQQYSILKVHVQQRIPKRLHLVCGEHSQLNVPGNLLVDNTTNDVSYANLLDLVRSTFGWDNHHHGPPCIEFQEHTVESQSLASTTRQQRLVRNTRDLQRVMTHGHNVCSSGGDQAKAAGDQENNVTTLTCRAHQDTLGSFKLFLMRKSFLLSWRWLLALFAGILLVLPVLVQHLPPAWKGCPNPARNEVRPNPISDDINKETRAAPTPTPRDSGNNNVCDYKLDGSTEQRATDDELVVDSPLSSSPRNDAESMFIKPMKNSELILSPLAATIRGKHSHVRLYPQPHVLFFHKSNRAIWKLPSTIVPGRYRAKARVSRRGPRSTFLYVGVVSLDDDEDKSNNSIMEDWTYGGEEESEIRVRKAGYYRNQFSPVEIESTGSWNHFRLELLGVFDITSGSDEEHVGNDSSGNGQAFVVVANGHEAPGVDFEEIFLTLIEEENDYYGNEP